MNELSRLSEAPTGTTATATGSDSSDVNIKLSQIHIDPVLVRNQDKLHYTTTTPYTTYLSNLLWKSLSLDNNSPTNNNSIGSSISGGSGGGSGGVRVLFYDV